MLGFQSDRNPAVGHWDRIEFFTGGHRAHNLDKAVVVDLCRNSSDCDASVAWDGGECPGGEAGDNNARLMAHGG